MLHYSERPGSSAWTYSLPGPAAILGDLLRSAAGDVRENVRAADQNLARVGPTHRRAFRVASGPIVPRSAFMSQHWFAAERPSPSARERVHRERKRRALNDKHFRTSLALQACEPDSCPLGREVRSTDPAL